MKKVLSGDERLRKFVNLQFVKLKRTAAVGSLMILTLNLSFIIYPYIEHRGVHPYIAIPTVFFSVILLFWLISHIYVKKMEMYRTEFLAEKILNPYSVYAIGPFEEMKYMNIDIVLLETLYELLPEGQKKVALKEHIHKVKNWCRLGYIPKNDFPDHLKKYYLTKTEARL
jgi:hypothetical protein